MVPSQARYGSFCQNQSCDNPHILATDSNKERLYVKESLHIRELQAYKTLNGNIGSVELKLW